MKTLNLMLAGSLLAALVVISQALLGSKPTDSTRAHAVSAGDATAYKTPYRPPEPATKMPNNA
jgi:hypothetical protein